MAESVDLRSKPVLRARDEPEGHEPPRLARQLLVLLGVDGRRLRCRARFKQTLDEEPGPKDLLTGGFQRQQPVVHPPALAPGLVNHPDIEVAAAVPGPLL